MLTLVWLTVRVRDQMLSRRFPREESLLAQRTLVCLQPLVDVPGVLEQITGR